MGVVFALGRLGASDRMKRREFIAFLGQGAVAWPLAARAQQPTDTMRRVGVLLGIADDAEGQMRVAVFQRQMRELGWLERENVRIEYRWAGGNPVQIEAYATELVGLAPEVIVGSSTPVAAALRQKTSSIPIVFVVVTDPVGNGFVTNLARPEGNITGFTNFEFAIGGKWLEILKEIAPGVARVGLMSNPAASPDARLIFGPSIRAAAQSVAVEVSDAPIQGAAEIERAINDLSAKADGGLIVLADNTTVRYRALIVSLAARHRVPAVYPYRYFVTSGGLVSYGIDTVDLYRRAAFYVDRILRGAKPADLPVQQPTKFELVINLRAAKALGLDIPSKLLPNEVIE
jgi:putative ABC transport system substrate-binding protein